MGVDFSAVAGYGKKFTVGTVKKEIADVITTTYDGDVESYLSGNDIDYSCVGSAYSGDVDYYLLFEDPLNNEEAYEKFKESLSEYFDNTNTYWVCELYVY